MTLARTGWRKQSMQEVIEKQAIKRAKKLATPSLKRSKRPLGASKRKKTVKSTRAKKMGQKRAILEKYNLPQIPCSRWGTAKRPTDTDLLRGMLWTVFSKYIRNRDKEKPCISCSKLVEIKQAGHYLPVGNSSVGTWFDEMNVAGECEPCNGFDTFHLVPMRKNLIKIYGEEAIEQLEARKNQAVKLDEIWYVDKIRYYLALMVE